MASGPLGWQGPPRLADDRQLETEKGGDPIPWVRLVVAWVALCSGPYLLGAEPRAIVSGPTAPVAPGNVVFLDASLSVSDKPLAWKVLGGNVPLLTFDKDNKRGVYALLPNPPTGSLRIAVTAVGIDVKPVAGQATPDVNVEVDVAVVEVVIGAPAPPPTPPPGPTPGPTPAPLPTDPFGQLGVQFGQSLALTYAETMAESASMLAAGVTKSAVVSDFEKRWTSRRRLSAEKAAAQFARVAPDDREPNATEKANLAEAWKQFAAGVRASIR